MSGEIKKNVLRLQIAGTRFRLGRNCAVAMHIPIDDIETVHAKHYARLNLVPPSGGSKRYSLFQSTQELSSIESTSPLIEFSLSLQMIKELSSVYLTRKPLGHNYPVNVLLTERHDEIELIGILERELKRYDKRAIYEGKDGSLCKNVCDLARARSNVSLSDRLEGIYSLCILFSYLHHFPKASFPNNLE